MFNHHDDNDDSNLTDDHSGDDDNINNYVDGDYVDVDTDIHVDTFTLLSLQSYQTSSQPQIL